VVDYLAQRATGAPGDVPARPRAPAPPPPEPAPVARTSFLDALFEFLSLPIP
jgi:hypothetical protein